MAPVPLNVTPGLRPWRQAGVTHLLLDDAALARLQEAGERPGTGAVSVPSSSVPSPVPSPPLAQVGYAQPAQAHPAQAPNKTVHSAPVVSDGAAQNVAMVEIAVEPLPAGLPQAQWPQAWQKLVPSMTCEFPVLWTYGRLAQDLAEPPGNRRGSFFRGLFKNLGSLPGSHVFWPLCPPSQAAACALQEGSTAASSSALSTSESSIAVPSNSALSNSSPLRRVPVDPVFFFSGVEALNPAYIFFLGNEVPEALRLPPLSLFQPLIHMGRRYVRLHDPDVLATDALEHPQRHNRLVSFLKALHIATS